MTKPREPLRLTFYKASSAGVQQNREEGSKESPAVKLDREPSIQEKKAGAEYDQAPKNNVMKLKGPSLDLGR